jgi:protoporphyrinogen oxidase
MLPPGLVEESTMKIMTRRQLLKLGGLGGLTLYVSGCSMFLGRAGNGGTKLRSVAGGPIDRSLPEIAPRVFSGDAFDRPHRVLPDKHELLRTWGSDAPAAERASLVVVGGGMSGLLTAYLLRDRRPVVLEQAPRFGGNSRGESWRGIDYSIGAAYFIQPDEGTDIADLLDELRIPELWRLKEGEDPVAIRGTIIRDFWAGGSARGERDPFARITERLGKLWNGEDGFTYPEIPVVDPGMRSSLDALDRRSLLEYLEEAVGSALHPHLHAAVEHYCWSSFAASAGEISAASGLNFLAAELGTVAVLPGGNACIAEAVVSRLRSTRGGADLRASCLVYDVRPTENGVLVAYLDADDRPRRIEAERVVLACPKFVVPRLLDEIEPERRRAIDRLEYRSYLVANVLLETPIEDPFYDLYLLGQGTVDPADLERAAEEQNATDVVLATFARPDPAHTVLTLYRAFPHDGGRASLVASTSYERFRAAFERQIEVEILPLLRISPSAVHDVRLTRWGHAVPVAARGLIAEGVVDVLRRPIANRIHFVEQDNWALPAFETCASEAFACARVLGT